ncbi:SdiA-regulated domain-containing protein [Pseudomonas aeruginosa]|nr:SdiA-regulated domain-containing protein [Pseudomonas aeruginosa]
MSRLMTYRTLLACLLAALLALLVAGQQQRAFERIWFKLEQRYGGDVARENALRLADYRVDIEARVLGAESNVSALSFDPSRRSLVSVTNQDPHSRAVAGRRIAATHPLRGSRIRRLSSTSGPASTWSPRSVANAWWRSMSTPTPG